MEKGIWGTNETSPQAATHRKKEIIIFKTIKFNNWSLVHSNEIKNMFFIIKLCAKKLLSRKLRLSYIDRSIFH